MTTKASPGQYLAANSSKGHHSCQKKRPKPTAEDKTQTAFSFFIDIYIAAEGAKSILLYVQLLIDN